MSEAEHARAARLQSDADHKRELGAKRSKEYRERQRGGPARQPKPCGTRAARVRHQRNPEKYGPLHECAECNPAPLADLDGLTD